MSRIVLISTYSDLTRMAESVAVETHRNIEVYEGWLEESGKVVDRLDVSTIDILMSRGGTAEYLRNRYSVPVVDFNAHPFDLMECLDEARRHSNDIILTSFSHPILGISLLERVLDVRVTNMVFDSLPGLEKSLMAISGTGKYCVVGGGPSVTYATKYGMPSVFLRTSRETLQDAFQRAELLANVQKEEKRKAIRLKAILEAAYDGILSVDAGGKIEIYNSAAERIMRIPAAQVLGQKVAEAIPNSRLDIVLKDGVEELNQFQDIGEGKILTSRTPVKDGNETIGAVATFLELSRVVQAERRMRSELTRRKRFNTRFNFSNIIAGSQAMKDRVALAQKFAGSELTVLIYGQSGTGKEMFAQSIHTASNRSKEPFVAINCGALPPTLLESELFGYEEGAFTGAKHKGKHGLFELAHGGTIFLDEIDALPVELQGRLLRVLQEREVLRVGGESLVPVDIRIIAATNQNPASLLRNGRIRADLFYRLNVLYLELPPLSGHTEDIPPLCESFLRQLHQEQLLSAVNGVMPYLKRYDWPGNVRELQNFVSRLSFYAGIGETSIDPEHLLKDIAPGILDVHSDRPERGELKSRREKSEAEAILDAIEEAGSVEAAAALLGIGRSTLWRKLKKIREKEILSSCPE